MSYILPPPTEPVPRLQLPPHGAAARRGVPAPLLVPVSAPSHSHSHSHSPHSAESPKHSSSQAHAHPRHRLGVACLALDASTQLAGKAAPEGILYSGGRDGLVVAWDLGFPLKPRTRRYGLPVPSSVNSSPYLAHEGTSYARWELMTGWADDVVDESEEEDVRDGDVLGDVRAVNERERERERTGRGEEGEEGDIPYEQKWETDLEAYQPGKVRRVA